jgi:hypothetical protein
MADDLSKHSFQLKNFSYSEVIRSQASVVRKFLHEKLNITPSFTGTGHVNGIREYIMLNKPLCELDNYRIENLF